MDETMQHRAMPPDIQSSKPSEFECHAMAPTATPCANRSNTAAITAFERPCLGSVTALRTFAGMDTPYYITNLHDAKRGGSNGETPLWCCSFYRPFRCFLSHSSFQGGACIIAKLPLAFQQSPRGRSGSENRCRGEERGCRRVTNRRFGTSGADAPTCASGSGRRRS